MTGTGLSTFVYAESKKNPAWDYLTGILIHFTLVWLKPKLD